LIDSNESKEQHGRIASLREFVRAVEALTTQVWVGIDPGVTGAIGFLCDNHYTVIDIPTFATMRKRKKSLSAEEQVATGRKSKTVDAKRSEYSLTEIVHLFRELKPIRKRIHVCLEIAQISHSRFGGKGSLAFQAAKAMQGYAMWPLFLCSKGYSVEEVAPVKWKATMGLHGKDKEASRRKAMGLFPKAPLTRKADHNRAEALLLAQYWRMLN
jgi:hypothetical protein